MYSSSIRQDRSLFLEARLSGRVMRKLEMFEFLRDRSMFFDKAQYAGGGVLKMKLVFKGMEFLVTDCIISLKWP